MHQSFLYAVKSFVEEIDELIKRFGLEEDLEHIIVPVTDDKGHTKRYFLLKRRFMRIVYPEGHFIDFPLAEVIEATVRYPELPLSEALYLMHKEWDEHEHTDEIHEARKDVAERTNERI
ncbi:MAG TPA: hypothetical protein VN328_07630 [Thermodesulfovibrionales bacterium]|nr:hypothetical protein [Thermodesulfovibrionales bacterium]